MKRGDYMKIRACVRNTIVNNNLELDYLINSFLKDEETLSKTIYEIGFIGDILENELLNYSLEEIYNSISDILTLILSNRSNPFISNFKKRIVNDCWLEIMLEDHSVQVYYRLNDYSQDYLYLEEIYSSMVIDNSFKAFGDTFYIKDFYNL